MVVDSTELSHIGTLNPGPITVTSREVVPLIETGQRGAVGGKREV